MLNELVLMMSITAPAALSPAHWPMPTDPTVETASPATAKADPDRTYRWWHKLTFWCGRKEVLISGRVVVPGGDPSTVMVLAEWPDGTIHGNWCATSGRFTVALPLEAEVRLRFKQNGHVEKVVTVDTRHAADGRSARRVSRGVRFDVELVPEEHLAGFSYDGPVGTISFIPGSGLMKVVYHEQLIQLSSTR